MGTLCRDGECVFNSSCNSACRHVPASLQAENQLPAPAGLCLSWLLGTFFQTISEHLLLSSESCMGKSTNYGNAHVIPPTPPRTPRIPAQLWHHAACLRCDILTHNPTFYNCRCFNIHAMPPPIPFYSCAEMSFHLPHHVFGSASRMELKVSS